MVIKSCTRIVGVEKLFICKKCLSSFPRCRGPDMLNPKPDNFMSLVWMFSGVPICA